jgi:AraC-like DNA-binding protein
MDTTTFSPANAAAPASESERSIVPHLQRSALFRDYVKAYETTTGLPLALRPTGTFQSPLHQSKQVNSFCSLMAANNQSCAACLRLQQRMETEAVMEAKTLQCFAGLTESAVPVRLGEKVLGHLQTGQVMFRAPSKSQFKAVLRHLAEFGMKVDTRKLETAFFQTRVIARKQYESAVRLVAVFAQHLATLSNQVMVRETTAELPSVAKARAFITEHMADEISLNDVAQAVNMSGFYFCKVFKKGTGLTFTDYLARTRVEFVKNMLLNPHTRVSEAAYAAGFQSLSQFNRVFRRIVGEAPTTYREHLHGSSTPLGVPGRSLPHAA